MRFIFAKNPSLNYSFPLGVHIDFLWKNLGGVYITPGRLSPRSEFTPVPPQSSTFVYMIPPQNVICWRESPRREFTRLLCRGENFTLVRNLATVSCKRETTTRFGGKSVCRWTGTGSACVMFEILNHTYILLT